MSVRKSHFKKKRFQDDISYKNDILSYSNKFCGGKYYLDILRVIYPFQVYNTAPIGHFDIW